MTTVSKHPPYIGNTPCVVDHVLLDHVSCVSTSDHVSCVSTSECFLNFCIISNLKVTKKNKRARYSVIQVLFLSYEFTIYCITLINE